MFDFSFYFIVAFELEELKVFEEFSYFVLDNTKLIRKPSTFYSLIILSHVCVGWSAYVYHLVVFCLKTYTQKLFNKGPHFNIGTFGFGRSIKKLVLTIQQVLLPNIFFEQIWCTQHGHARICCCSTVGSFFQLLFEKICNFFIHRNTN